MRTTDYRLPVASIGVLGLIVVVRLATGPLVRVNLPAASAFPAPTRAGEIAPKIGSDSVAAIVSRDPFRIGHWPALPAYDPLRLAEQLAPPPPRPALVLAGLMDGVEAAAVIEGFPGVEGARVVREGDVIGLLTVRKVGSGRVVITGMDTTWVLQVREPWKN
jgi:hypothetical protein